MKKIAIQLYVRHNGKKVLGVLVNRVGGDGLTVWSLVWIGISKRFYQILNVIHNGSQKPQNVATKDVHYQDGKLVNGASVLWHVVTDINNVK